MPDIQIAMQLNPVPSINEREDFNGINKDLQDNIMISLNNKKIPS